MILLLSPFCPCNFFLNSFCNSLFLLNKTNLCHQQNSPSVQKSNISFSSLQNKFCCVVQSLAEVLQPDAFTSAVQGMFLQCFIFWSLRNLSFLRCCETIHITLQDSWLKQNSWTSGKEYGTCTNSWLWLYKLYNKTNLFCQQALQNQPPLPA